MHCIQIVFARSCDRKYEHYVFALSVVRLSLIRSVKYRMSSLSGSQDLFLNLLNKKARIYGEDF